MRIQHPVPDFDRWREAFDSDPEGREQHGVLRYRIMRACDDEDLVLVDLEFDGPAKAEVFLAKLRGLWRRVDVMREPHTRLVELVQERSLGQAGERA